MKRHLLKGHLPRLFVLYLTLSFLFISAIPVKTFAYVVESGTIGKPVGDLRAEDMAKVQRVLEAKVVGDKLERLGISKEEVNSRLERLSDEELHQFASHITSLYPGGDSGVGIVIALLLIVILVIVIMQLMDKKIVIKDAK